MAGEGSDSVAASTHPYLPLAIRGNHMLISGTSRVNPDPSALTLCGHNEPYLVYIPILHFRIESRSGTG